MSVPPNYIQTSKSRGSFFNNPANRALIYQFLLLMGLGYFFYIIISNTMSNMEARGIKSGISFLGETAGFDILMSLIPYDSTHTYGKTFIVGLLNTLLVSVIGIFLATIIGFIMGVAHFSRNWLISKSSTVFIETFRNIPLLLQVFFWYFAVLSSLPSARQSLSIGEAFFLNVRGLYLPHLAGDEGSVVVYGAVFIAITSIIALHRFAKIQQEKTGKQLPVLRLSLAILIVLPLFATLIMGTPFHWELPVLKGFNYQGGTTIIPELIALSLALSIYTGAFIAEAVRAGVQSVPHGQTEAARSIGMNEKQIMKLIIVPQAMRVISPLLNSEYQSLVKNSTLATAIGYPDLFTVFVGTTLNQTGQAIEIVFMTMAVYFAINMFISVLMNLFDKKVSLITR
ncbi:MAG: amino acid ABC transporter permease [Gammaproteobacteria bacterium]|nr:amino acid ABC transporter permease [Gammaproteobacteria bacterium]